MHFLEKSIYNVNHNSPMYVHQDVIVNKVIIRERRLADYKPSHASISNKALFYKIKNRSGFSIYLP